MTNGARRFGAARRITTEEAGMPKIHADGRVTDARLPEEPAEEQQEEQTPEPEKPVKATRRKRTTDDE